MNSKNVITRDQVNLNANYVEESAVDAGWKCHDTLGSTAKGIG